MKKITLILQCLLLILACTVVTKTNAQSRASYTISFTSHWDSETNDPINGNSIVDLPGNAHWSDLVGATHNNAARLLEMGSLATEGIKDVAELGNNTAIMNEVQALINSNHADQFLQAAFDDFAPRTTATLSNIEVSEDFPLLSLAAMIAPSPDWMIAVNSINLRDGNTWVQSLSIPLFPYDAGTDSGVNYNSGNQTTMPAQPITSLVNVSPFNDKPIGVLTITFNQTLSIQDNDLAQVSLYPNPSNGMLNITTSASNPLIEVQVYNVLGKQIERFVNKDATRQLQLDLTQAKAGIYIVKIKLLNATSMTKKIVIN
ncbi:spondin domain-containing protein [Psychroserpens algicola]|uniref:T9SS type A sorting domain-containing protein n=1 Tax=Psychroserpens algicola TaxID=1719034 RepID=UPI001953EB10|nr:spondin domain-containing protein [Psychroserpens algicola]